MVLSQVVLLCHQLPERVEGSLIVVFMQLTTEFEFYSCRHPPLLNNECRPGDGALATWRNVPKCIVGPAHENLQQPRGIFRKHHALVSSSQFLSWGWCGVGLVYAAIRTREFRTEPKMLDLSGA